MDTIMPTASLPVAGTSSFAAPTLGSCSAVSSSLWLGGSAASAAVSAGLVGYGTHAGTGVATLAYPKPIADRTDKLVRTIAAGTAKQARPPRGGPR